MIDKKGRDKLAEATRALVAGRITNDEFEARIPQSDDPAVKEIFSRGLWFLYCDLSEHRLIGNARLDRRARDFAARCIVFLKSGQPYSWPVNGILFSILKLLAGVCSLGAIPYLLRDEEQMECWPFASEAHWKEALKTPSYLRGGV